jgi:hypothetical protein
MFQSVKLLISILRSLLKLCTNPWIEFKTNKGVSVSFTATGNVNAIFIAHSTLAYGGSYSVILHGNSVKDLAGNGILVCSTKFTTILTIKTFSIYGVTFKLPCNLDGITTKT